MRLRTLLTALTLAGVLISTTGSAVFATERRPGCGFGDPVHSPQAALGQDPMNLRPGATESDPNRKHTVAPGQTTVDAGDPADSPRRGCEPGRDGSAVAGE